MCIYIYMYVYTHTYISLSLYIYIYTHTNIDLYGQGGTHNRPDLSQAVHTPLDPLESYRSGFLRLKVHR